MPCTYGLIGGGNMGSAILRGAITAGVLRPDEIIVAEPDADRRKAISLLGCATAESAKAAAEAEIIILAVKPQMFPDVAKDIGPLKRSTLVISIMAGCSSERIHAALGEYARVVRAMPNIACQVGHGMTGIALGKGAKLGDEQIAVRIFEALGRTCIVKESLMHAVTAVSGSGPAYVFLLCEAMEQAAAMLGMSKEQASLFARQTVIGAAQLLEASTAPAHELRNAVTSPGGTTAAALEHMFERELPEIIEEAILLARNRGVELDQ